MWEEPNHRTKACVHASLGIGGRCFVNVKKCAKTVHTKRGVHHGPTNVAANTVVYVASKSSKYIAC
jgi:hypothetical protein